MSTLFDALIKISTDLAETGLLVMDSAMRAAQGGIESLAGQRPAGPLTEPPVEGPRDLDSAISDLANRTARIARFTPFEIESAPTAVTDSWRRPGAASLISIGRTPGTCCFRCRFPCRSAR